MKKNVLFAVAAVLMWSTLAPVGKMLVNQMPNMEVLFLTSALAAVFLIGELLVTGRIKHLFSVKPRDLLILAGLGILGMFGYNALYFVALSRLSAQMTCVLNYLWPLTTVLFACLLLGEKMNAKKGIALLLSFAGVAVLTVGPDLFSGAISIVGILAIVGASSAYSLFAVLNKKFDFDQEVAMTVFWGVTALAALAIGLPTENWVMPTGAGWLGHIWTGCFTDGAAYLLWALAFRDNPDSAKISNLAYASPFLALLWCNLFLKEKIQPAAIIALLLIVSGILLQSVDLSRLFRKKKTEEE